MKKSNIACFVAGAIIFGAVGAFAGQYVATENTFPIQLNGNNVNLKGYNIDGNTYFKLRDISDTIGGFSVDFNNNTIQLSKNGYKYTAVNNNNNGIQYYTTPYWCPDFGAYTGATLKERKENMFYYYANMEQINKYEELLLSLGYTKGYLDEYPAFVYDDQFIILRSDSIQNLGLDWFAFLAGAGDWVQSSFTPAN